MNVPKRVKSLKCSASEQNQHRARNTMSANSILLDFSLDPARIIDEVSRKDIVRVCKEGLEKYLAGLKISYDMLTTDGYLCILSETGTGTIVTIRFFEQGLITINVEYYRKDGDEAKISFEVCVWVDLGG